MPDPQESPSAVQEESTVTLELSQEEVNVLNFILYCGIGGPPEGPRKYADSLLNKVRRITTDHHPAILSESNRHILNPNTCCLYLLPKDFKEPTDVERP